MDSFIGFFRRLFASDFMPHGHCFFWQPSLLWLHVLSDGLITFAYYSIPITLYYFIRKRPGLNLRGLILMFAAFILACGTTHAMSIWDLWHSTYRLEGVIKAVTAILSAATAIVTVKLAPVAMAMMLPDEVDRMNQTLREEIEARKKVEAQLRELMEKERHAGNAKFEAIFEGAPQAIVAVDGDGRIVLANQGVESMFGYERAELLGKHLKILIPERSRPAHAWHRTEYLKDPRTRLMGQRGMQLAGRRKDGSEFPCEIGLSYVPTAEGILVLALVNDITSRKHSADQLARANAELRAREAQLRSYLEAASQAILAVSQVGRIVLVNQRTEEMFGYTRQELLGLELEALLPERYRGGHVGHRAAYFSEPRLRGMGAAGMSLSGRRKDGSEFPVEIGLSFVEGDAGGMALGLVSDITERKRTMDQLAQVNAELRQSNSELEQFASVASHDLQEPLRMISSYMLLLKRRYRGKLDSDADDFIEYAVQGCERMKRLILDLLNFSRAGTQVANFALTSAEKMLQRTLVDLKTAIDESAAVITSDPLPQILADPGLLGQVLQNLISNAIKFQHEKTPEVHISVVQNQRKWVFSVRDNGIGIDLQHAERVFQIFQRLHTDESYSGTGIGLAISKKIVERHGGEIWFESRRGEGTTFFFSIPT
jgi:PAS domain S-box-containing protein